MLDFRFTIEPSEGAKKEKKSQCPGHEIKIVRDGVHTQVLNPVKFGTQGYVWSLGVSTSPVVHRALGK